MKPFNPRYSLRLRIVAISACVALAWTAPVHALRPMGADSAGMEEEIGSALSLEPDGETAAGLEEMVFTYRRGFLSIDAGRRSMEPLRLGRWLPPLDALDAAMIKAFMHGRYLDKNYELPVIRWRRRENVTAPELPNFRVTLRREEAAFFLNRLSDFQKLSEDMGRPTLKTAMLSKFQEDVLGNDPRAGFEPDNVRMKREHAHWKTCFKELLDRVLSLRMEEWTEGEKENLPFQLLGLRRIGREYYEPVPAGWRLEVPLDAQEAPIWVRVGDIPVFFHWQDGKLELPDRRWMLSSAAATSRMSSWFPVLEPEFRGPYVHIGRDPYRAAGIPIPLHHYQLRIEGAHVRDAHARVLIFRRTVGSSEKTFLVIYNDDSKNSVWVQRPAGWMDPDDHGGEADRWVDQTRSLLDSGRFREGFLSLAAVVQRIAITEPDEPFNRWTEAADLMSQAGSALEADGSWDRGGAESRLFRDLAFHLAQEPPVSGLPEDYDSWEKSRRVGMALDLRVYESSHEGVGILDVLQQRWFPVAPSRDPTSAGLEEEVEVLLKRMEADPGQAGRILRLQGHAPGDAKAALDFIDAVAAKIGRDRVRIFREFGPPTRRVVQTQLNSPRLVSSIGISWWGSMEPFAWRIGLPIQRHLQGSEGEIQVPLEQIVPGLMHLLQGMYDEISPVWQKAVLNPSPQDAGFSVDIVRGLQERGMLWQTTFEQSRLPSWVMAHLFDAWLESSEQELRKASFSASYEAALQGHLDSLACLRVLRDRDMRDQWGAEPVREGQKGLLSIAIVGGFHGGMGERMDQPDVPRVISRGSMAASGEGGRLRDRIADERIAQGRVGQPFNEGERQELRKYFLSTRMGGLVGAMSPSAGADRYSAALRAFEDGVPAATAVEAVQAWRRTRESLSHREQNYFIFGWLNDRGVIPQEIMDLLPARFSTLSGSNWEQQYRQDQAKTGLEEPEVMTAAEFSARYASAETVLVSEEGKIEELLGRSDVRAAVVNLPKHLYIYVWGKRLFYEVMRILPSRSPSEARFVIFDLPREEWYNGSGLIYKDPMEEEPLPPEQNPKELPVHELLFHQVEDLDPFQVLAQIYMTRLGIPESKCLGGMVFEDADGQAKLVLFS